MAFVKETIGSEEWTLIASDVFEITFQNIGQHPLYLNFSTSATPPSEEHGLVYNTWNGELKTPLDELTKLSGASHVFLKAITNSTSVIYEE